MKRIALAGPIPALLTGCIFGPSASKVSHQAQDFVAPPSAAAWESHPDDFMRKWLREPVENLVPAGDPLVERVQGWIDAFDTALRKKAPEQFGHVPKPTAAVIRKAEVNGYSFAVPVCFKLKVELPPPPPGSRPGYASTVDFLANEGRLVEADSAVCLDKGSDLSQLEALVAFHNAQVRPEGDCRLVLSGETLSFQGPCGNPHLASGQTTTGIRMRAVSTRILVTTGLLASFSEENFVAALAHELAHYYRAHAITPPARGAYYYEQAATARRERPAATQNGELVRLGDALRSLGAIPFYAAVPGQTLHRTATAYALLGPSRNGAILGQTLPGRCGLVEPCRTACSGLTALWEDAVARGALVAQAPEPAQYLKMEAALLACAPHMKIEGRGRPGSIDTDILEQVMPPALVARASESIRHERPRTLMAGIEIYSRTAFEAEKEYVTLAQEAQRKNLGFYTTEQEADDLLVELLAAVGMAPSAGPAMMLDALRDHWAPIDPAQWDFEKCRQERDAGWPGGIPPVGDWSAFHHGSCYRVFNMSREIQAHGYVVDESRRPRFLKGWNEIQALAKGGALGEPNDVQALLGRLHRLNLCAQGAVSCFF